MKLDEAYNTLVVKQFLKVSNISFGKASGLTPKYDWETDTYYFNNQKEYLETAKLAISHDRVVLENKL